jgi:hypothetical protein
MVMTGWRAAALLLVALAVAALLIAVAVWALIALALVGAVLWLNLVLLPRLSRRLHVPGPVLEVVLLAALAGPGWLVGRVPGAVLGGLVWLAGIAVPRLVGRRLRTAVPPNGTVIVVESPALPTHRS